MTNILSAKNKINYLWIYSKSFLAKRRQNQQKKQQAFLSLQQSINKIINSDFKIAADHGEIWHEIDKIKQEFLYFDESFFCFIENIEKLLIEFLRLQKKIHSEILHKRSAKDLIKKEKELCKWLQELAKTEFVEINRGLKKELKMLVKEIDKAVLKIK